MSETSVAAGGGLTGGNGRSYCSPPHTAGAL
jgi:hypothetical protein